MSVSTRERVATPPTWLAADLRDGDEWIERLDDSDRPPI